MKKKIIVSVVLAVILAATMTVGCFALESSDGLMDSKSIYSSSSYYELASTTREYSYNDNQNSVAFDFSIQSKAVSGDQTNSSMDFIIKKLNVSYSDAQAFYNYSPGNATSFYQYIKDNINTLTYNIIGTPYYASNINTYSSYTNSTSVSSNELYYFDNKYSSFIFLGFHKYSGSIDRSVLFALDNSLNSHFYYTY